MPLADDTHTKWPPGKRYGVAVGIFAVAFGLRYVLLPVEAGLAFVTFSPAAVIAFYLCGPRAGC